MTSIEKTIENFLTAEPVIFPEFILEKANRMFGTSKLENDDVCAYFIQNLKKFDKKVRIVEDDSDGMYSHFVGYVDEEDPEQTYYAIFCSNSKEECLEFCKKEELDVEQE